MANIKFEIKKNVGVIKEKNKGWKKELNVVSWNDSEAKYDIREWDAKHEKMGKGVTFTDDELEELHKILSKKFKKTTKKKQEASHEY